MPFLDKTAFQQKLRDGDAMGIPREVTYQNLRQKYQIEGDPGEKPTVEKSGGVMQYLGETIQGAAREIGGAVKFGVHYATNPQDIIPDAANTAVDTVQTVTKGLMGAAENIGTHYGERMRKVEGRAPANLPLSENQQAANAIGEGVKSVVSDPLGTFKNHPLSTLSVLAPTGAGALRLAGLPKAARVVGALDPLNAAVKTVTKGPAIAGRYGKEILGLTTGAGGGATDVAAAAKGADSAFFQGMRGDPLEQAKLLITDSQKGLSVVKAQRSAAYKKTNEALKSIMEPLSDKPVKSVLNKTMKDFNITDKEMGLLDTMKGMTDDQAANHLQSIMNTGNGELSPLVKAGIGEGPTASKIGKAIHYVQNWDDYTPDGLDRLQKSLSSIDPKPGSPESAFITTIKKGVQNVVKEKYPEYSKLLDDYHTASDQIDEMQAAIGSNNRASIETAVRKMSQSMKTGNQGFEIRNAIISQLQDITGLPIKERIAGMAMNQAMPRGLAGVASGVGVMGVMAQMISPSFLVGLAMSSPRVVGEVLGAIGVSKGYIIPVMERLKEVLPFNHLDDLGRLTPEELKALTPEERATGIMGGGGDNMPRTPAQAQKSVNGSSVGGMNTASQKIDEIVANMEPGLSPEVSAMQKRAVIEQQTANKPLMDGLKYRQSLADKAEEMGVNLSKAEVKGLIGGNDTIVKQVEAKLSKSQSPKGLPREGATTGIPKELDAIANEAKKYKTADEFYNAYQDAYKKRELFDKRGGGYMDNSDIGGYKFGDTKMNLAIEQELSKIGPDEFHRRVTSPKIDAAADFSQSQQKVVTDSKITMPKNLETLAVEARKYKSAEEFVNNRKLVFHGTNSINAEGIAKEGFKKSIQESGPFSKIESGPSFTSYKPTAQEFANHKSSRYGGEPVILEVDITDVKNPDITKYGEGDEIYVPISEIGNIKTKSQLIDLWNQANQ